MTKFRKIILILAGIIILLVLTSWYFGKTVPTELSELRWEKPPGFIAIDNISRDQQTGLLFIRLKDKKEQFIAGSWKINFSENGAYAFGAFPKSATDDQSQHIYHLSGDGRIYHIQLADPSLVISSVKESTDSTYLFIEIAREHGRSFCVIPRLNDDKPDCQQLDIGGLASGLRNPAKQRELVLRNENGQIFVFDPWEKKPLLIDPIENKNQFEELSGLFTNPPLSSTRKPPTFRLLNILFTKQSKTWRFVHVPFFAKIGWLHDWSHLLVVNDDKLSIQEPFTKKEVFLFSEAKLFEKSVFFRSNGFDDSPR